MSAFDFSKCRRDLDDAITYDNADRARELAREGLMAALYDENMGEVGYFRAQFAIIDETYSEAIRWLDLAIRLNPSDGAAYNDRALCRMETGEPREEVLADFDKGIAVEPDYATILHNKGWYLIRLKEPENAIPYLKHALSLEPERAVTYENLADAYLHLQRPREAALAYHEALRYLDPQHEEIRAQIEKRLDDLNTG